MKFTKPTSFTVDTEQSPTNIFQSQLLRNTNLSTFSQDPTKLIQIFSQPQHKQSLFLKTKNQQLQEKVKRLQEKVRDLQNNKIYLLKINENYVNVLNRYYCDQNTQKNPLQPKKMTIQSSIQYDQWAKKGQKRPMSCQKHTPKHNETSMDSKRFEELQKDHRNLTQHCLVMQRQIKNYSNEMQKFTQMKAELQTVNHTSPKQLIHELQQVVIENKMLKKQNSRLSFELQKIKQDYNKVTKVKETQKKQASVNGQEIQKLKSQINMVVQESKDKADKYQQRIYEQQLKVSKLQNQLRTGQKTQLCNQQKRKSLQVSSVEDVAENNYLRTNLSELLDPKKHLLLSTSNIFLKERLRRNHSAVENKSKSQSKKTPFIL